MYAYILLPYIYTYIQYKPKYTVHTYMHPYTHRHAVIQMPFTLQGLSYTTRKPNGWVVIIVSGDNSER